MGSLWVPTDSLDICRQTAFTSGLGDGPRHLSPFVNAKKNKSDFLRVIIYRGPEVEDRSDFSLRLVIRFSDGNPDEVVDVKVLDQ